METLHRFVLLNMSQKYKGKIQEIEVKKVGVEGVKKSTLKKSSIKTTKAPDPNLYTVVQPAPIKRNEFMESQYSPLLEASNIPVYDASSPYAIPSPHVEQQVPIGVPTSVRVSTPVPTQELTDAFHNQTPFELSEGSEWSMSKSDGASTPRSDTTIEDQSAPISSQKRSKNAAHNIQEQLERIKKLERENSEYKQKVTDIRRTVDDFQTDCFNFINDNVINGQTKQNFEMRVRNPFLKKLKVVDSIKLFEAKNIPAHFEQKDTDFIIDYWKKVTGNVVDLDVAQMYEIFIQNLMFMYKLFTCSKNA